MTGEDAWELVHPPCALERADDMAEVHQMVDAGETEIAIDELRWLLDGCTDFIEAHKTLGEIALLDSDLALARAHFGYAYELGRAALERRGIPTPLPYQHPPNQAFFEAGKGLIHCLKQLGENDMAANVVTLLLRADPSDPLGLKGLG